MTKRFFLLTAICILLTGGFTTLVSCNAKDSSHKTDNNEIDPQIIEFVDGMRKGLTGLHQQMGDLLKDATVEIEGKDIVITVVYDFESQGIDPEQAANVSQEQLRTSVLASVTGADPSGTAKLGRLLEKNNMRIVFNAKYGKGIKRQIVLTGKDLIEPNSDVEDVIETMVQQINSEYESYDNSDGILRARAYQNGNTIVHEIYLDAELEDSPDNRELVHQTMITEIVGNPILCSHALTMGNAGIPVQFKYIGTNGESISYTFSPAELKEIANQ